MAIHEVDIFYPEKCPSESETVFVDYKTVFKRRTYFLLFCYHSGLFTTTQITGATRKATI